MPCARHVLGTRDGQSGEGGEEKEFGPRFGLAARKLRAIDLSCRAMRAVRVLGAGLGFPVGPPSVLNPQPPIKLQRGVIGISDIEWAKLKDLLAGL